RTDLSPEPPAGGARELMGVDHQAFPSRQPPVERVGFGEGDLLTRRPEPRQGAEGLLSGPGSRPVGHGLPPFSGPGRPRPRSTPVELRMSTPGRETSASPGIA